MDCVHPATHKPSAVKSFKPNGPHNRRHRDPPQGEGASLLTIGCLFPPWIELAGACRQDGDDGNHHQKLDQSKPVLSRLSGS